MSSKKYADAGVDTNLKNDFIKSVSEDIKSTHNANVIPWNNGFAGLFALDTSRHFGKPVLVSAADGVGTKLKMAARMRKHDTIGIDLVAMCVNDIATCGAKPLFFLDYIAANSINHKIKRDVIKGIVEGCNQAQCAVVGGETAQMPGMFAEGIEYDVAGFCVGVVDADEIIDGSKIQVGDSIIGFASSGPHSNGFSLINDLIRVDLDLHTHPAGRSEPSLGDWLLTPTTIYSSFIYDRLADKDYIRGLANITGGGFHENIPRILPEGMQAVVDPDRWPRSEMFSLIQRLGKIDNEEMYHIFNMGIGMIAVVDPFYEAVVIDHSRDCGISAWSIGSIQAGDEGVVISDKNK